METLTLGDIFAMLPPFAAIAAAWVHLSTRQTRIEAAMEERAKAVDRELKALHDEDRAIETRAAEGLAQVLDHLRRIEDRLERALQLRGRSQ